MRHGELKHIFDILERAFGELGIDYYLIGALARQVWYEKEGMAFRATKDVDYAALIGSHQEYEMVQQYLKSKAGFYPSKENAFVMIAPDGTQVDILPFGEIEHQGSVKINGKGMTSIQVAGMMEVYESGTQEVALATGNTFKVATLPGIAMLKFIAYDDRPERRQKDAQDIANLVLHFFNLNQDMIYDHHLDLFDGEIDLDIQSIGAVVLGREMRKIANTNSPLVARLDAILSQHIGLFENSPFIRLMVQSARNSTVKIMADYLKNILWGFNNPAQE